MGLAGVDVGERIMIPDGGGDCADGTYALEQAVTASASPTTITPTGADDRATALVADNPFRIVDPPKDRRGIAPW